MAGRNDYGVLRSSLLTDERAHRAAEILVESGIAVEALALSAVVGVIVELGLWAMRETDDGVLDGSGVIAIQQATMCDRATARKLLEVLSHPEVQLLRPVEGGVYLTGFRDCYASVLEQREANRTYAARSREKARQEEAEKVAARASRGTRKPRQHHVSPTSGRCQADVSSTSDTNVAERSVAERSESPPSPSPGESDGLSAEQPDTTPRPLRPRVRERLRRVLDYVVRAGRTQDEIRVARALRDRGDALSDAEVLEALEGPFAWVTPERLARSLDSGGQNREDAPKPAEETREPAKAPSTRAASICRQHGRSEPCSVCETAATPPADPQTAKAHVQAALAQLARKPRGSTERIDVPPPTLDPAERERIRAAMSGEAVA